MYVIAGATGRVGSATASSLLAAGAEVRVIVRRHADAEAWRARGAQAYVGSLADRAAMTSALAGSAGLFVLLPFDLAVDDLDAYADGLIAAIAGAVTDAGVPHVVMLSSGGADLDEGTGPITGLHRMEKALLATGTTLTALRSGHFQEKVGDVLDAVLGDGVLPVFAASADVPLPMAATADIGAIAAQCLLSPPARSEVVDVLGPAYTERQVAAALAEALDRDVQVVTVPAEAWASSLVDAGLRPHVAASLAELHRADERGLLAPRGDRRVRTDTAIQTTIARLLAPSDGSVV